MLNPAAEKNDSLQLPIGLLHRADATQPEKDNSLYRAEEYAGT